MATRTLYVDDGYAVGDNYTQTGITVDWRNKIVFVPKIAMTLIQSSPTIIYQLELNAFRLALKELEASIEGMSYDDIHSHNTEVSVGGVTLARVIQIINDYTVTFEDGQYAVNLIGANSNVGDRVNVNQVSVRSANSAGLVTSAAIEFGEYGGGVTVKPSAQGTGTVYPKGTERDPVNNLADALQIAAARGFNKLFIKEDITVDNGLNYDGFTFIGESQSSTDIYLHPAASLVDVTISTSTVSGTLDGGTTLLSCTIGDLEFFNGIIDNCILTGNVTLAGTSTAIIVNSSAGTADQFIPVIDMGGDGPQLALRNWNGGIKLINKTGTTYPHSTLDINSGQVVLDSTITEGTIIVRGIGKLTNNTTGNAIVVREILDPTILNKSLFSDAVSLDTNSGFSGILYPTGTPIQPCNNIADAYTIALNNNLTSYMPKGTIILDRNYFEWDFMGAGTTTVDIDVNGYDVGKTSFSLATVRGTMNNTMNCELRNCVGDSLSNFYGKAVETALVGSWTFATNTNNRFVRCSAGFSAPTFNVAATNKMVFSSYSGDLTISGANQANTEIIVDCVSASITIANSCVAGSIVLRGVGHWANKHTYSGTTQVINAMINPHSIWDETLSGEGFVSGSAGYLLDQAGDIANANINISGLTTDQANTLNLINATTQSSNTTITAVDSNVSNIVVNGALTIDQATMLMEIYALYGLDPFSPLIVTDTSRTAGANVTQTINSTATTTTVTRV